MKISELTENDVLWENIFSEYDAYLGSMRSEGKRTKNLRNWMKINYESPKRIKDESK